MAYGAAKREKVERVRQGRAADRNISGTKISSCKTKKGRYKQRILKERWKKKEGKTKRKREWKTDREI